MSFAFEKGVRYYAIADGVGAPPKTEKEQAVAAVERQIRKIQRFGVPRPLIIALVSTVVTATLLGAFKQ